MANVSAFGFSGWDPLGSFGEGSMSNYFHSKSSKKSLKRQYEYYKKSLLESPSLQRQGLEDAGYNPMLAISSGLPSPFTGSGSAMSMPAGASGGFDATEFASSAAALKNLKKKDDAATETAELGPKKVEAEIKRIEAETRNINTNTGKTVSEAITQNPLVAPVAAYGGYKALKALKSFLGRPSLQSLATGAGHSARSIPALVAGSSSLAPLVLGAVGAYGISKGAESYRDKSEKGAKKQFHVLPWPNTFAPTY